MKQASFHPSGGRPFLRLQAAGIALALACGAPASAQSFGDLLKSTVKRAVREETQRKADEESRKAARCAMGEVRCLPERKKEEAPAAATQAEAQPAVQAASGAAGVVPPPFPGSDILLQQSDDYTDYALRTGKAQAGGMRVLEGRVSRTTYRAPQGRAALEVFRSYQAALRDAGFTTLFACAKAACGDIKKQIESDKRYLLFWGDGGHHYQAARLARPQGDVYVAIYATRNASGGENRHRAVYQVDVVELPNTGAAAANR